MTTHILYLLVVLFVGTPNMELSMLHTVPFVGRVPLRKYSRMAFVVHCDVADSEVCYNHSIQRQEQVQEWIKLFLTPDEFCVSKTELVNASDILRALWRSLASHIVCMTAGIHVLGQRGHRIWDCKVLDISSYLRVNPITFSVSDDEKRITCIRVECS